MLPNSVTQLAKQAMELFPSNVPQAIAHAEQQIRSLPEFPSIVDTLIHDAIQGLVYDARHRSNVAIKKQAGAYNKPATVNQLESSEVQQAHTSLYSYYIGGTVLGEVMGFQIDVLANREESSANGHLFNAALLRWLKSEGVVGDRRVKDVISEKKLKTNFNRLRKEIQGEAA